MRVWLIFEGSFEKSRLAAIENNFLLVARILLDISFPYFLIHVLLELNSVVIPCAITLTTSRDEEIASLLHLSKTDKKTNLRPVTRPATRPLRQDRFQHHSTHHVTLPESSAAAISGLR